MRRGPRRCAVFGNLARVACHHRPLLYALPSSLPAPIDTSLEQFESPSANWIPSAIWLQSSENPGKSWCLRHTATATMHHVRATRPICRIGAATQRAGQVSRRRYANESQSTPPQPTPPHTPASPPNPNTSSKPPSRVVCLNHYNYNSYKGFNLTSEY